MNLPRIISLVLFVSLLGCGEPTATIKGVVNMDGAPISLPENVRGTVIFQPSTRQGPTLNGSIEGGGKFQLAAGSNSLVAPGVYLATVSATELLPATEDNPQPSGKRITPDKYANSDESGLRFVIKPGENNIVVDLESDQTALEPVGEESEATDDTPASDVTGKATIENN